MKSLPPDARTRTRRTAGTAAAALLIGVVFACSRGETPARGHADDGGKVEANVSAQPSEDGPSSRPTSNEVKLDLDQATRQRVLNALQSKGQTIRLELNDLKVHADKDVAVRVFIRPPGAPAAPSTDDPSYVGTIGSFGPATRPQTYYLDATQALQRLTSNGKLSLDEGVRVQLIPVDRRHPQQSVAAPVTVESGTLRVSR
jgi:hypothetical protein